MSDISNWIRWERHTRFSAVRNKKKILDERITNERERRRRKNLDNWFILLKQPMNIDKPWYKDSELHRIIAFDTAITTTTQKREREKREIFGLSFLPSGIRNIRK